MDLLKLSKVLVFDTITDVNVLYVFLQAKSAKHQRGNVQCFC